MRTATAPAEAAIRAQVDSWLCAVLAMDIEGIVSHYAEEAVMHNAHVTQVTLVLGGTGQTGRRVTARLMTRRVPGRVGSHAGVPRFNREDRAPWASARREVDVVPVTDQRHLAVPGAVDTVRSCAARAVPIVARRLRRLSGQGEAARQCADDATPPGVWGTQR